MNQHKKAQHKKKLNCNPRKRRKTEKSTKNGKYTIAYTVQCVYCRQARNLQNVI